MPQWWWSLGGAKHGPDDVFVYGDVHRVGQPALAVGTGCLVWRVLGVTHRVDGPAIPPTWYCSGMVHRVDGPALDDDEWHVAGVYYPDPCPWQRRTRRLRWLHSRLTQIGGPVLHISRQ